MAKKRADEKKWYESGQRWAYPLGDRRWIAVQITEVFEDGPAVALAYDAVFDGVPTAAQLDSTPWLQWEIGPVAMRLPARGEVARFALDRHPISPRAAIVDSASIREGTELGPPNVPHSGSLASVSLRVWQHWHHRYVTGAWGRATLDRPTSLRWQNVSGLLTDQLERLREQPPPLVLAIGECSQDVVDLSGISAQAIVLDAGRGFQGREIVLPAHIHTLCVRGRHSIQRVICHSESAPLAVSMSDGWHDLVAGLEDVRVVSLVQASNAGISAAALASWTRAEEIYAFSTTIVGGEADYRGSDRGLAALDTLTLAGMADLGEECLPLRTQVPSLRMVHVGARCAAIKAIRERYAPQAAVVRYTTNFPSHSSTEHQFVALD